MTKILFAEVRKKSWNEETRVLPILQFHCIRQLAFLMLGLSLLTLMLGFMSCQPAPQYKGRAKILVFPGPFSFTMMEARFIFLLDYLEKETQWKFDMVGSPIKGESLQQLVETEDFAFAIVNPYVYLLLAEKNEAVPILRTISFDGRPDYRGVIVCRGDSPIQFYSDLRGKLVLASSRVNVGGFISQWVFLKEHGLDPDQDIIFEFGSNQEEILEKISSGRAEAGFVREDVLNAFVQLKGKGLNVRVIAFTSFCPNPCIVKFRGADAELTARVKEALLSLDYDNPDHRFILGRLRISGFAPATPEDYTRFHNVLLSTGFFSLGGGAHSSASEVQ